jgi:hypothetical protein
MARRRIPQKRLQEESNRILVTTVLLQWTRGQFTHGVLRLITVSTFKYQMAMAMQDLEAMSQAAPCLMEAHLSKVVLPRMFQSLMPDRIYVMPNCGDRTELLGHIGSQHQQLQPLRLLLGRMHKPPVGPFLDPKLPSVPFGSPHQLASMHIQLLEQLWMQIQRIHAVFPWQGHQILLLIQPFKQDLGCPEPRKPSLILI